jgi:hypothetical protein
LCGGEDQVRHYGEVAPITVARKSFQLLAQLSAAPKDMYPPITFLTYFPPQTQTVPIIPLEALQTFEYED